MGQQQLIRLCNRQTFAFTTLAASGEVFMAVARRVNAMPFTSADLLVRVHSQNIQGAAAKIEFDMFADGYTTDDPTIDWTYSGSDSVTIELTTGSSSNVMKVGSLTKGLGSMLLVGLHATQRGTGGQTLTATVSIDLVLKGA